MVSKFSVMEISEKKVLKFLKKFYDRLNKYSDF